MSLFSPTSSSFLPLFTLLLTFPGQSHSLSIRKHGNKTIPPPRIFAELPHQDFLGGGTLFNFKPLPSNVNLNYDSLPASPDPHKEVTLKTCPAKVRIDIMNYDKEFGIACLFKGHQAYDVFPKDLSVSISGSEIRLDDAVTTAQHVTGFILGEHLSRLHGVISEGSFFGSVRLFNRFRNRFIVYYVEPAANAHLYSGAEPSGDKKPVIFEFIPQHPIPKAVIFYDDPVDDNFVEDYGNPKHKFRKLLTPHRRKRDVDILLLHFSDVGDELPFPTGRDNYAGDTFDLSLSPQLRGSWCGLCIWIDEMFALRFSLGTDKVNVGLLEVIDILSGVDWTFRSLDFNGDTIPDLVSFRVNSLIVSKLTGFPFNPQHFVDHKAALKYLETNFPVTEGSKRCCARIAFIYDPFVNYLLSASNIRGMCDWKSSKNIGLVTGSTSFSTSNTTQVIKLGRYDVQRSLRHVLGHLFGAGHNDDTSNKKCKELLNEDNSQDYEDDDAPTQAVMDSTPEVNIGLRPNSLRFSYCARAQMTIFLQAVPPTCLFRDKNSQPFCGNGLLEKGEQCDCGALWQCAEVGNIADGCICGARDSSRPCRFPSTTSNKTLLTCPTRPVRW